MNGRNQANIDGPWLFYDGNCPVCRRWVERLRAPLSKHGFQFAPQQGEFAQKELGLNPGEIFPEMKVITGEGRLLGGADAGLYMARLVWWARPFWLLSRLPGGLRIARRVYAYVAARRECDAEKCKR